VIYFISRVQKHKKHHLQVWNLLWSTKFLNYDYVRYRLLKEQVIWDQKRWMHETLILFVAFWHHILQVKFWMYILSLDIQLLYKENLKVEKFMPFRWLQHRLPFIHILKLWKTVTLISFIETHFQNYFKNDLFFNFLNNFFTIFLMQKHQSIYFLEIFL